MALRLSSSHKLVSSDFSINHLCGARVLFHGLLYHHVAGLFSSSQHQVARLLSSRLKECGFSPSIVSYGCLINLYTKIGKISKALEVSKVMKNLGIKHNMKTYSMLFNGFVKLKDWANAFSIFEDITKDGLKADVILYNNIVKAFCVMDNMDRAICIVKQVQRERHKPTTRTFFPIIHGFTRTGELTEALQKTFPLDSTSHNILAVNCEIEIVDPIIDDHDDDDIVYYPSESDNDERPHEKDHGNDTGDDF